MVSFLNTMFTFESAHEAIIYAESTVSNTFLIDKDISIDSPGVYISSAVSSVICF